MSTTVQDIINRALDRSGLNYADQQSIPALVAHISNQQRKIYLKAAQLDPEYFGKSATTAVRGHYTDSWNLDATPGDVAVVTKATVAAITGAVTGVSVGDKVNLVNSRFPDLDVSPRAYVRGRAVVPHLTELGAADGNMVTQLTISYSPIPAAVSAVTTTVALPEEWTPMLTLSLAKYMAIRDKQAEDVPLLDAEYQEQFAVFAEAVVAYGSGVRRPLQAVPAIPNLKG